MHALTGQTKHTTRQAADDLRKLRGKQLIDKPGRNPAATTSHPPLPAPSRPCSPSATRSSRPSWPVCVAPHGRKPKIWTAVDRDYENIGITTQTLLGHLGLDTVVAAA